MGKIALITGTTSGIGKTSAELLISKGFRVIITGRRKRILDDMLDRFLLQYNGSVHALNFDIQNRLEVDTAIDSLPEEWKNIDILINNAGLAAGLSPFQDADMRDWEQMIDTNLKGLIYVTKAVAKGMIQKKSGHIINVGSIAGKEVYPNGNVYCATKHAVDALTKAMRMDFLPFGIRVTQIAPGAVETEFSLVRFKGDQERANAVYEGFEPLNAEDVSETILFAINRPKHVNINDIVIMPTAQASAGMIYREKPDEREW
jgi:3-hydroxy acid dehydrogenase / malonic semialdehyde reductase